MSFRAAVLTVSDTASQNASYDRSGPIIKETLESRQFYVHATAIVPDDEHKITSVVTKWASEGVDWIITTGGTGFGERDRTPEAVRSLIDRDASGLVHIMLSSSLTHTPFAALARPVAGTIKGSHSLVVTLPGSVKAVKENLACLLGESGSGIVGHALELLRGSSGKQLHSALPVASGSGSGAPSSSAAVHDCIHNSHHEHHGHNHHSEGTSLSNIAGRARKSPYALISYHDALQSILRHAQKADVITLKVEPSLRGYVLAEDVYALQDVPSLPTTNVDGYALHHSLCGGTYGVSTPKSHPRHLSLPPNTIYRINTGAPLPAGTDSVIMVEDTELVSATSDGEEEMVKTLLQVSKGENVRQVGSDVKHGDLVIEKGTLLAGSGGEIGTLVFVGRKEVRVFRKPVVAILSTGNELVDIHPSENHQSSGSSPNGESWTGVWDTNRPSLRAVLEAMGYEVKDLGIVEDTVDAHVKVLREGLASADLILTTGGTSMGASDLLKPVIEECLNGTIHFGRVTIKPGKPTTFATIPFESNGERLSKTMFALPGNPASALVCFYIFVLPALRRLGGWREELCQLPRVQVKLLNDMGLDPRMEFHRVVISSTRDGLVAASTGGQRSSRVASMCGANGLAVLPQKTEDDPKELQKGSLAEALVFGEIQVTLNNMLGL